MTRRRLLGTIAAVLLTLFGTFVLIQYVRTAEARVLAGQEVTQVLVVDEPIPRGAPANEIRDRIRSERVSRNVLAEGSVASLDDLGNRVAAVDLVPGEQLVTDRFIEPAALEGSGQAQLPEGHQVVTIQLEPQRAVGGQIAAGDTVGVLASFQQAEVPDEEDPTQSLQENATTAIILHKVLVTNVQGAPATSEDEDGEVPVPAGALLVSLAVDAPEAERVVFAAEHGTIWLTLEPEDANEQGTRIQRRGTIYR